LQVLGVVGAALLMLVWAVERRAGLINAWDIWAQPLLAAVLLVHVLALWRWPAKGRLVRISGGLCFNAYLVASVLLLVLRDDGRPDSYQFVSTMYWLPLSYGVCFLFLPTRWALWLAVGVFGATFGPIAIAALAGGSPRQWPGEFATLVWVLGGAQVAYIALLRTVATVRDAHRAAEQRMVLMQSLATTDVLTGLPNRRAMIDHLHAALAMAERHGQPVSVAVFDVDHFKRINDQHGHGAGDQALMAVGRILSGPLRGSDRVGRWGGEEYLLVAPGTALGPAAELADRLRRAIESHAFEHGEPVTTSVGVAEYHPGDDADALLQRADRAMYRAKSMGRNRTEREACPPGR
jgi:diguanylate cyclase (GGDEF)-like protein